MSSFNKITKNYFISALNLSQRDLEFLERIYNKGLFPYTHRLKQYGFERFEKVLDAGCGFGQWSLSLAQRNTEIHSCDADHKRVEFLHKIASENKITNIHARQAFIDNLPYDSESFDAVFCYGVIFLTPWKKSLSELVRVLKPGGKLYVNANGLGWYKHLWYTNHNKTDDYDPQLIAANAWRDTYNYNNGLDVEFPSNLIIEPNQLINEAENLGLSNLEWDGEGLLNNPDNINTFFQKQYYGDTGVYEIIGTKK